MRCLPFPAHAGPVRKERGCQGTAHLGMRTLAFSLNGVACHVQPVENAEVRLADFFELEGQFDFIFDYTFFCAIPPSLRPAWGRQMGALLKPGGKLLTIIYPIHPDEVAADPAAAGPPHPVSLAEYKKALEPHFLRLVSPETEPASTPHSVERRAATEQYAFWQRFAEESAGLCGQTKVFEYCD